jgi:hypothetical protein
VVLLVRRHLPPVGLSEDVPCLAQRVLDGYQCGKRVSRILSGGRGVVYQDIGMASLKT